jgi:uracil-DNA glycosylase
MNLIPDNYHISWEEFLNKNNNLILEIEDKIGDNINPEPENVLRFLNNDLNKIKVIILGQDPYPEKGRATGRAFEVGDLHSWNEKFRQVSLKNIIRSIHKEYRGYSEYKEIKKFSQIQNEIKKGEFKILPPDKLFKSWENQGVLLLNTYLSVEVGNPGSHKDIWEKFNENLLEYISEKNKNIKYFLWGKHAESRKEYIKSGELYISRHPMMCSSKYEEDFMKNPCFKETKNIINWLG